MKSNLRPSEAEVAAVICRDLEAAGWITYKEVLTGATGLRPDIVAVRGPLQWVIEVKVSIGMPLLVQACRHRNWYGNYISVAAYQIGEEVFYREVCRSLGIGLIRVSQHYERDIPGTNGELISLMRSEIIEQAKFNRNIWKQIELREEQRNYRAGNSVHEFFSPFRNTVEKLKEVLKDRPGITLKEAVSLMTEHHYRDDISAVIILRQWIGKGTIKGIRIDRDARPWKLYLEEEK